jgi:hypothetical protein
LQAGELRARDAELVAATDHGIVLLCE